MCGILGRISKGNKCYNKNDFVNCTLNSRLFFSSLNSERQDTYTFSEYLRSLSSD